MSLSLPSRPNLDQLKKQAKELLKLHHTRDRSVCPLLRVLHRFNNKSDEQIFCEQVALGEIQSALALEYGFITWADLKAHVLPAEQPAPLLRRQGSRVWLENMPAGMVGSGRNRQLMGLRILLAARGAHVDLDDLLVYGGNAFCFSHPNLWHETTLLAVPTDFMSNAAEAMGFELEWHLSPFRKTMAEYETLTHAALNDIRQHIDRGQPVLTGGITERGCQAWSVVVGYDAEQPQLAHIGLGPNMQWLGIRGAAFPCNAEENLDKHWNAQVQKPHNHAFTHWMVNPYITIGARHAINRQERVTQTLKLAVDLYHLQAKQPDHVDSATYWFGAAAFEHVASNYDTASYSQLMNTSPREVWCRLTMIANQIAWLSDDRRAAASFCRKAAQEQYPGLAMAAAAFEREAEVVTQGLSQLTQFSTIEMAAWFAVEHSRKHAAAVFRKAATLEQQAMLAIEQSLQ